jgi:hypothetical protein
MAAEEEKGLKKEKSEADSNKKSTKKNDKEEERQKWLEEVKDDPYIGEARRVLTDMRQ